uniref:Uncharacterized protein n=1 Tax=Plectus sambesii TaxID=2011161 RepID=A0A914URS7_9BILA
FAYSPQLSQASTSGSRPDVVPESEPPQASSPNRARNCDNVGATDRTERFCSLRTADGAFEKIALRDPQESVAKWTRTMAASRGLSTTGTEAVDDQTGVLIDPARQAMDALGNRSVRLEAAVLFRVELAASTSTERKLVAVKAKHGAPAGAVLRPVLTKYGVDLDKVVVCFAGSNEFLPHSESISKADKRKLIIMSPLEFQDYINTPRVDMLAQSCPTSSFNTPTPSPTADWTIPYHPLGDVCVAELPLDEAGSRSKHSAVRSLSSHAKSDHPSGLGGMLKFVRKASHSTKDDSVA